MREVWKLAQQLGPRTAQGFANICSLTAPQIELMHTFFPYGDKGGALNPAYGAPQGDVNSFQGAVAPFLRSVDPSFRPSVASQFSRAFDVFHAQDPTRRLLDELFRPGSIFSQVIPGLQSTPTSLPTATPPPTPTVEQPTPTPDLQATVAALVQDRMAELQSPRQLQDRAAQALKEARRSLNTVKWSDGIYLSEGVQDYLLPSAAYGFQLAPFLRPELSAKELDNLSMAQFLGQGLQSLPTVSQIAEALFQAATAGPKPLTKPQADLARGLLRPESNELVFQMATAPGLAQMGPVFGPMMQSYREKEFARFQVEHPHESFLQALVRCGPPGQEKWGSPC